LRGVGSDAFLLADPSIVTYIDGVYNPFALGQMGDFGDVERIEVLKGPQGTLFGRNAIGGAINIVSRDPSFEVPEVNVQVNYGSFDAKGFKGSVSYPIFDNLAISLAGTYNRSEHLVDGMSGGKELPEERSDSQRVKLQYTPSDWLNIKLGYSTSKQSGAGTTYSPNTEPSPIGTAAGIEPQSPYAGEVNEEVFNRTESETFSARLEFFSDNIDIVLLASDQYVDVFQPYDIDGSTQPLLALVAEPGISDAQTAELQILSNPDGFTPSWLEWIFGVYFFKSEQGFDPAFARVAATDLGNSRLLGVDIPASAVDIFSPVLGALPLPSGTVDIIGLVGTESIAYYTQSTISFSDSLSLTLGLRYQEEDRWIIESSSAIRNLDGSKTQLLFASAEEDDQFEDTTYSLDPKVSLNYMPNFSWLGEQPLLFASWQTAKKGSTFNVLNIYDTPEYVEPEEITAYELGIKTSFQNGMSLNAAVFLYQLENQQVQLVSLLAGGAVQFENAGTSETLGADFDLVAPIFPSVINNFVLSMGMAFLKAEYSEYKDGSGFDSETGLLVSGQDYTGNDVVLSPKVSGNATLLKTLYFDQNELELAVDYYYNSGFYYLAQGTPNVEESAYELFGARLSYFHSPSNLRVTLYGKNLTGEEYNYGRFPVDTGTNDAAAPKENYGIRVGWEF
jgi:iron complex outermembrane receptor protein